MMESREKISNRQILSLPPNENRPDQAYGLVDVIAANRPLHTRDEASSASNTVNNILSYLKNSTQPDPGIPADWEQSIYGLQAILEACQLVSLRVEQYIDQLPYEEKR